MAEIPIGGDVAGYRIEGLLGRGGMGVVYLAYDARLERRIALKLLPPEAARDEQFVERFLRETRLAARVDHPNIVPVFDAGEVDDQLYLAMRYVDGSDLRALLLREGALEPERAVALLAQVARGLDAAHAKGLVHRDVKPANILVSTADGDGSDAHVYLSDFGLAREAAHRGELSATGVFVGTIDYTAPEQLRGEEVTARTDVYGLGCVLYQCLTGHAPFRGNEVAVMLAHLDQPPPRPSADDPRLAPFDPIIQRAAAKDPAERYETCSDLIRDAQAALGGAQRRRHRGRWLAVVAAGLAAIGAGAVALTQGGSGKPVPRVSAGQLVLIDAAGKRIAAAFPVAGGPASIAATPDGDWVALTDSNAVVRVDRATGIVTQRVATEGPISSLVAAGGAVWATDDTNGELIRIDPQSGQITQRVWVGNGPGALAAAGSTIWVANRVDGSVERIDATTGTVGEPILIGSGISAITAASGSIWVASADQQTITRVDPDTGGIRDTIPSGHGPVALAAGAGSVWVANRDDATISRIDPSRDAITSTIPVGNTPTSIAWHDNALWIGDAATNQLHRLNPDTTEIDPPVTLGSGAAAQLLTDGDHLLAITSDLPTTRHGGTLTIVAPTSVQIDPGKERSSDPATWVWDGLIAHRRVSGSAGYELVPDLAQVIPRPTDQGTTYTFHLRPGIRFSTGKPLQPSDVAWTFQRLLGGVHPDFGQYPRIEAFRRIVGATGCIDRPKSCDLSGGVVADDDAGTVTFHLTAADPAFPELLASTQAGVVPEGTQAFSTDMATGTGDLGPVLVKGVPGTGPYAIEGDGMHSVFRRNRYFKVWSAQARPDGEPDLIEVRADLQLGFGIQAKFVEDGRADAAVDNSSPASQATLQRLSREMPSRVHPTPSASVSGWAFNTSRPPFSSVEARQAVNYATNRALFASHSGASTPACQVLPPGSPGFVPFCPYVDDSSSSPRWSRPDLARAKDLLREAGLLGARVVVATMADLAEDREVVRTLRRMGFRVIERRSPLGFPSDAAEADADMWSSNPFSDIEDTTSDCSSADVRSKRWCDGPTRTLLEALKQQGDSAATAQLRGQLDQHLTSIAAWLPLVAGKNVVFVSDRVGRYGYQPATAGAMWDRVTLRPATAGATPLPKPYTPIALTDLPSGKPGGIPNGTYRITISAS